MGDMFRVNKIVADYGNTIIMPNMILGPIYIRVFGGY
jgi:hypothetical protein